MNAQIFPSIIDYCKKLESEFDLIDAQRKEKLLTLSEYFIKKFQSEQTPKVIVICTHNSRRSHMGQVWLAIGADYYKLKNIETYSGGTEATAFNHQAIAALQRVGLKITTEEIGETNPFYELLWRNDMPPYPAFSKRFDDVPNPNSDFAAMTVCSEADEACPVVTGSDFRIHLPFEDPKAFDNTEIVAQKYDERCQEIGREMFFVLSNAR